MRLKPKSFTARPIWSQKAVLNRTYLKSLLLMYNKFLEEELKCFGVLLRGCQHSPLQFFCYVLVSFIAAPPAFSLSYFVR